MIMTLLTALPILAFGTLLLLRWRNGAGWLFSGSAINPELATIPLPTKFSEALFNGGEFRRGAQQLRKQHYRLTSQLHVQKTVDVCAARAGLFCPIYRERPQSPEYVFLIEQHGINDHLARLFDLAVERLRSENVFIQRYYFHTDPRQVQADDAERTVVALPDLIARTYDHCLFVLATGDGFFHPLSGEVESWVKRLQPWRSRTMLSTRPLEQWTVAELRLLEEGFSLATAQESGFVAAGEKIASGDYTPELLEGVVVIPLPARRLL